MPILELAALSHPDRLLIDGSRFLSAGRDAEPALIADDGRVLTYRHLREESLILRERFGVGKKLVLIIARNDPDTIFAYLSALDAGHAVVVIAPEPTGLVDHVCEHYNPNIICMHDQSEWRVIERHTERLDLHSELACLLSTSGTTGEGKFVRLSYRNLVCNALSIAEYLEIEERDRFLLNLPINYSYGLSILNSHLVAGSSLLLTERSVTDPELWRFFRSHEGTGFAGVPHTYKLLEASKFEDIDLPSLRTITQAGGRLPEPLARKFAKWAAERGIRFFIMYGQTEASPRIAYLPPSLAATSPDCIGRAIPGGVLELVDAEGKVITDTETEGELQYTGPNVMMGYATRLSDLALGQGSDVLRTGDVAVVNSAGLFRITGRQKRFLKIYGLRISLDEVERKLEASSIKALCGGNDELLGVMTTDDQATDIYLKEQASRASGLPPAVVVLLRVEEFPVLPSGKFDYRSVSQQLLKVRSAMSRPQMADASSVDNHAQKLFMSRIERIFSENLPGKRIGATDSFVSLGGDSLSYVAVAVALEELIPRLPVHWERLTVTELEVLASQSAVDISNPRESRSVESTVLIRAIAPVLVVMNHAGIDLLAGGAVLLLAVVGMNFSRFQIAQLIDGRGRDVLWNFVGNVLLPYWLIVVGYQVLKGEFSAGEVLLYGNMALLETTRLPFGTWFIQVIAQSFLILGIVLWFRPIRRFAIDNAFRFGLILVSIGVGARILEPLLYPGLMANGGRELPWVFWIFAIGLTLGAAESRRQKVLLSCLVVILPQLGYPMDFPRSTILTLGCLLVTWVPRINMPSFAITVLGTIGSASLFIYMLHPRAPVNSFTSDWPVDVLRILIGIGLGICGWWCYGKMQHVVKRYLERLRGQGESAAFKVR